jgi:hypothetical protein
MQGHSNNSYCGSSHWKAARNTINRQSKLDETGLVVAGCRHSLAESAVNMHQGELMATHIIYRSTDSFVIMLSSYGKMLFVNTGRGLPLFQKIYHLTKPCQ